MVHTESPCHVLTALQDIPCSQKTMQKNPWKNHIYTFKKKHTNKHRTPMPCHRGRSLGPPPRCPPLGHRRSAGGPTRSSRDWRRAERRGLGSARGGAAACGGGDVKRHISIVLWVYYWVLLYGYYYGCTCYSIGLQWVVSLHQWGLVLFFIKA